MSITLMAYPMAFLISPEQARKEKLRFASEETTINNKIASANLKSIKVLTNIRHDEILSLMANTSCEKINDMVYAHPSGLKIQWQNKGKYVVAYLFGNISSKSLQTEGEQLFTELDKISARNVRLIDSSEYFYYNYETDYTTPVQIYTALKDEGATQIFSTSDNQVVANLNGQSVKYYLEENEPNYILEVEQKVNIMNIGLSGDFQGTNVTYGLTNLKIQTNIKPDELKMLLKKANYLFYQANNQTPLKNSNATLNWVLKNGYYCAEFSGSNNSAITKEAEIIFRKLNIAAGRDLRLINDVSTVVYTYTTNYTDKGMLLNTLTEHGAEEISENGDEISCKLFGMEMVYYKKENSNGYTLDITQVSDKNECENLINDLNEEYGLNIQEMTYNKIKERLEQENMRLESETVMDDNSIVLTIDI
ncbi:hypothetical protein IJ541_07895 [bacterium]|nr:hypothetical protein [bacterium]